ncbi:MAG: hypothetical protein ACI4O5_03270 [Oscillospiraceae bacterium]
MIYDDTEQDLRDAGFAARKALKESGARHVVYAYADKNDRDNIHLLGRDMLEFKTDEQFDRYLKQTQGDIEILYAVHIP